MLAAALTMAWAQLTVAQSSAPRTEYSLTIPSGSLTTALDQFSKQTGLQVAAELKAAEHQQRVVEAVIGRFTAEAALERLLAASDLSYVWEDDSTIRIYEASLVAPHGVGNVHEVTVTGSRLAGRDGPAPVRIYTRADIDRFGVSSLPSLAAYFTQQPSSAGEWAQRSGAQHFQMRGLGVDTTLVLINGRRVPPSATSVTLNAFDLNTIPLTAVDHIEVMSDSASAIYGADAIGGVVNIILKKSVKSPEFYLHYGDAAGGGTERRVAASVGSSREHFKSAFTLDYFDRGMLLGGKRDLWRNQDYTRFGGTDYRVTTASPANVYSLTGQSLPGLPTAQASVPAGSAGLALTPEDFLATAGMFSLDSANKTWSILPKLSRLSASGSAEWSLGKSVLFGELLLATSDVVSQGDLPSLRGQVVSDENPYNPFGEAVAVDYALVGMKPVSYRTESEFARFVLGAQGQLLEDWDWETVVTNSLERVESTRMNDLDPSRVRAALESSDPRAALNPFVDGPGGSKDLLSSLVADPQKFDFVTRGLLFSAFLRGELFRMPGGMSEFVVGGEWRSEQTEYFDMMPLKRERDITSGFAEIMLPLTNELLFKAALRGDYYENADDSVNPQYGLVWRPLKDWLFQATYGTSFRPPSLVEQYPSRSEFPIVIADPKRGSTVSTVKFLFGGNPDLENVTAHSFTGGVVYQRSRSPELRFGTHYWRVVMDNRIVVPRLTDLGAIETALPGRVRRSGPTSEDTEAGWPGAIESVDFSLVNFGRLETSGIDLDLSYKIDGKLGRLRPALSATWVERYSVTDIGTPPTNRVGIASLQGTVPRWRLVGSLAWERNGWGISATTTFTPEYDDSVSIDAPARRLPSRALVDMQAWLELDRVLKPSFLGGLKLTAGALNVLDEDVDFANAGLIFGYDITQAELKQRFAYLRITKSF
jgi:iron complex outermembrane receptor protein